MVVANLVQSTSKDELPSYPFMWTYGGVVWLRTAHGDTCVIAGDGVHLGEYRRPDIRNSDKNAWDRRLPEGSVVTLTAAS